MDIAVVGSGNQTNPLGSRQNYGMMPRYKDRGIDKFFSDNADTTPGELSDDPLYKTLMRKYRGLLIRCGRENPKLRK